MDKIIIFKSLTFEQKVEFFLNVQKLLVQYHPDNHFVFREDNKEIRKQITIEFIKNYKGFCFSNENINILFNKIFIDDPNKVLNNFNIYQESAQNYNTISVDFVVMKEIKDLEVFCRLQYNSKLKWVTFVKNKKIRIFESEKILGNLGILYDSL